RPRVVGVLLRVGGLVTVEDADAVRTLDLMTGQERWSVARGLGSAAPGSTPVTDGVRVLLPGYDVEQGRRVTAYDLSDGTPRWTVPLPWRVSALAVSGGVLVGTGDQMVVFG
ncbi:MAG TPA: PQQ-binding-like beta-propeller repeat protein, partial [Actinotalea sp.]